MNFEKNDIIECQNQQWKIEGFLRHDLVWVSLLSNPLTCMVCKLDLREIKLVNKKLALDLAKTFGYSSILAQSILEEIR